MLMAAVSGLLMHRHLFTDLFTLRGRVRTVGLRDLHTVAATWTLPHAFVLAFTGAFFSFALSIGIPLLAYVAFSGDQAAMFEAVVGGKGEPDPRPAAGASFDQILSDARLRTQAPIRFVSIEPWGRADTRVTVIHEPAEGQISGATLVYAGETGSFISQKPALGIRPSIGGTAFALMGPLHFGNFAGWWSKAIWFALGAASAYVTWSGLVLWLRRRENQSGWRAFGRVVAWVGAGLPFAMAMSAAAFFVALPSGTMTWWTPTAFLLAAAAALVPALLLSAERIVPTLFSATGIALLSLPCLRLASGGPGWISALQSGQATILTFDLLMITGALVCLFFSTASLRRETSNEATIVASQTPAE
jgi:PepSY-associated TM region